MCLKMDRPNASSFTDNVLHYLEICFVKSVYVKDRGYLSQENERKRDVCVVSLL